MPDDPCLSLVCPVLILEYFLRLPKLSLNVVVRVVEKGVLVSAANFNFQFPPIGHHSGARAVTIIWVTYDAYE